MKQSSTICPSLKTDFSKTPGSLAEVQVKTDLIPSSAATYESISNNQQTQYRSV